MVEAASIEPKRQPIVKYKFILRVKSELHTMLLADFKFNYFSISRNKKPPPPLK